MALIDENSIVEKSRFLLGMKAPNYELGELKVLDTYLARINARDPQTQAVTFTKEEYENLMGFTDSRPETLRKRTEGLLGKVVTVPLEDGKKGWRKLTLFTKAECIQDDFGGYVVNLNCNPELQPLFFNVENAGYLRYRLRNVLPLTSKYSMLLYLFLKDNLFRGTFDVELKEFKERLGITAKRYEAFKHLRPEILDKALSEVNEKTDVTASYQRIARGKLTVGLTFTVVGKKPAILIEEDDMEQIGMFDDGGLPDVLPHEYENQYFEFLAAACNYEFDQTQMEILLALDNVRAISDVSLSLETNQMNKYHYLEQKYKELNYRCARTDLKPVKDRFAYIKTIIEAN